MAGLFIFPKTNLRINDTVVELQKLFGSDIKKQTNPRVFLWEHGLGLITKKPFLGYGVGDAKGELTMVLKDCDAKLWDGKRNVPIFEKNFNFHNQYMQTWAEVGVFGFLILLFIMIHPFLLKIILLCLGQIKT